MLTITDEVAKQAEWTRILTGIHASAFNLPFSGKRNPFVVTNGLSGFTDGQQEYDYPLHTLEWKDGSTNEIVVAPKSQTGLFKTVGRLDAHTYRPNEFWASNMVYEGLVKTGANGAVEPSLATSWTITDIPNSPTGDQLYTFTLRPGVTFHDGAAWNCKAAKMNFDNVFAEPLKDGDCCHGWYDLVGKVKNQACPSGPTALTFTFETTGKYYPTLNELGFIRPLRMLSPTSFVGGANNNATTQNSCMGPYAVVKAIGHTSNLAARSNNGDFTDGAPGKVTCAGIQSVSGTGPWQYNSLTWPSWAHATTYKGGATRWANGSVLHPPYEQAVDYVTFKKNPTYWGGAPSVSSIKVKTYDNAAAVKAALIAGTLHVVAGPGVLEPADVKLFQTTRTATHTVHLGPVLANRIVIINANKAPTDDTELRKAIIHAVDKTAIIAKEMQGMAATEDSLFPKNAPYCGVDLTPRWDYDLQKAQFLNCPPAPAPASGPTAADDDDNSTLAWVLAAVFAGLAVISAVAMFKMGKKKGLDEAILHSATPSEINVKKPAAETRQDP